jgi:acetyl-CoA acyltransferase
MNARMSPVTAARTRRWHGREPVIAAAVRTPIGRAGGALAHARPDDLAAAAVSALLARARSLPHAAVDEVYLGAANQAGEDNRNVGRMASLLAGLPTTVPGATVNRLCGSGMEAVVAAARGIAVGDLDVAVAGGVESMTRAPFVLPRPEAAMPKSMQLADTRLGWRLTNPRMPDDWTVPLGETAERVADRHDVSRHAQDAFAARSHANAVRAWGAGEFADEVAPVAGAAPGSTVDRDEGPRPGISVEALSALRTVFRPDGTVTAGNSSPLNDGAAALLLCTREAAAEHGLPVLATVVASATAGVDPDVMGIGPVPATQKALGRAGLTTADVHAFEVNEAFASQAVAVLRGLGVDEADPRVNARGGAVALGHPLGCSGARILTTLVHRLASAGGGVGVATMCIGVGQGITVVVEAA